MAFSAGGAHTLDNVRPACNRNKRATVPLPKL